MNPATPSAQHPELRLRITIIEPPAGMRFAMQRGRFDYINVGASAGPLGSPWTHRIKVPLLTPWAPATR
jgi:hypothetical protein